MKALKLVGAVLVLAGVASVLGLLVVTADPLTATITTVMVLTYILASK